MPIQPVEKIWLDGTLTPWHEATTHVLTHSLHYGNGVFEGIRAYETSRGVAVFRLRDHIARIFRSAKIIRTEIPYTPDELVEAVKLTVRENNLPGGYIRPLVYRGYGEMGLDPTHAEVKVMIACWPWGKYIEAEGGCRVQVSSWQRHGLNILPPSVKATGMYLNSILAKQDALSAGFHEAILLNQQGYVAEATGENVFVVKNGVLLTPPSSAGALAGIRRETVMTIAREEGMEVREENLMRTDLYLADEVFFTGTAAEIAPVRSVDNREVGPPGPVTLRLQEAMQQAVVGEREGHEDWAVLVKE